MSSMKNYIGSGKNTQHNGVKVTLRMDEAMEHVYTTDKGRFLTFIVSPKQQPDQYGKTHSAFILPREERAENAENQVSEPTGVPEGEVIEEGGKRLKKITKQQAAIIRRKKNAAQAQA